MSADGEPICDEGVLKPLNACPSEPAAEPTPAGLDPMYLPPSISAKRRGDEEGAEDAAKPAPKRRAPVRKLAARKPEGDSGDLLDVAD